MTYKESVRYRETLLVIVLGFSLLYLFLDHTWLLYVAVLSGIPGLVSLRLNRWIHLGWYFIGEKLGFVVNKIVLGIIYLLVLVLMGMLSRLFRKDILNIQGKGGPAYHLRKHQYTPEDFENLW
jgi:hypothetical protein